MSATSATTSLPPSTVATSRAVSPEREDHDEEDFMFPLRGPPPTNFQDPPDGERPLAPESERYLCEPSGWRQTGKGPRKLSDFRWFIQEYDDDGILELWLVGEERRKEEAGEMDQWWDFVRCAVYCFEQFTAGGRWEVEGERLTKPMRLYKYNGAHQKVVLYDTERHPDCRRVWQSRPQSER